MEPTRHETRTPADEAESVIQDMLDRWEDAWQSGEELSAETLCADRPDLKTEVAGRIAELKRIDGFLSPTDTVGKVDTEPSSDRSADLPPSFGQFEILDRIAQGGMGAVYRAQQKSPSRVVALKVIRSGDLSSQKEIDRFFAEANAAANLSHPNIVPVFEVGEENGRHYFTMEYIAGRTLSQIVRTDGPMKPKQAAELMTAIAEAVHYAHDKGVIHRDIKPANVIVDEADRPRVTDFGIAKQLEVDTALTATGQILGTPEYMSPEQAQGQQSEIDRRSDVFSLGATLYAMLTGRSPFRDEEIYATLQNVIEEDPTSPRKLQPKIDKDLETICLKCLQKKPGDRYATAKELADDLRRYLDGTTITARRTPFAVRGSRWIKRHPAIAVFSLLVCAGFVWGGFRLAKYINYERVTTKYYMNVEDRWHVRVGVGEITEEQARQRHSSWKIVRKGRKDRCRA